MDEVTVEITESEFALCRCILYEALALGFRFPTEDVALRLASVEGTEALAAAAAPVDSVVCHGVRKLASRADELEGLSDAFRTVFGHTARGAVPPYETEYGANTLFLQPQEMSDIGGFMGAFGLTVDPLGHERIDHISCECEFLRFLCQKEAYALDSGDEEMLTETRKAERLFLKDHLGRFGPAFGRRVAREDREGFYGALGELCAVFIEAECRRAGVPVGPEHIQLRSAEPDDVPMACASECGSSGETCSAVEGDEA